MTFGTYSAMTAKAPKPKKKNPPPVPAAATAVAVNTMNILLIARTASAAVDLAAGLHTNISPVVNQYGLVFYSKDTAAVQELIGRQKQISACLLGDGDIRYPVTDSDEIAGVYPFLFGAASGQRDCFRIEITCTAASAVQTDALSQYQAVWILADALCYEGQHDSFTSSAAYAAGHAKENGIPVCVIAGQFEKLGKIRDSGGCCSIERELYTALTDAISAAMGSAVKDCPVFPVQIYGGLSYLEKDASGNIVLGENIRNGLSVYKPAGCHIPLLFAAEALLTGDETVMGKIKKINSAQRTAFTADGIVIGGRL